MLSASYTRVHAPAVQVLGTANKDFTEFADVLASVTGDQATTVAVTSQGDLDAAHEEQPGFFNTVTTVL